MTTETDPLIGDGGIHLSELPKSLSKVTTYLLVSTQVAMLVFFFFGTTYAVRTYEPSEYSVFRDIMVMLLLGFGYLMTFLGKYGLGAVGFTMMVTAIAMQVNIPIEFFCRYLYGDEDDTTTTWPLPVQIDTLIDAEFAAATLLISFGAIIGRAAPVQLIIMALLQSFCYAFNKVFIVLGLLGAEDVGGSITIHMFGAYFGLAASKALGPPVEETEENANPSHVSDTFAFIGTTLLWVYWPSFVGATETGDFSNENLCVIHTVLALLGSTVATFYLSQHLCEGKYDPVHIANSTLAGGVAVGSSARLAMTPGGALFLGVLAGLISVAGYQYSSPFLESKFSIYDTCGVGNLHGWPSVLGGLASMVFVAIDSDASFLEYSMFSQVVRQFVAVVATLVIAIFTGTITGKVMLKATAHFPDEFDDGLWWEGKYY